MYYIKHKTEDLTHEEWINHRYEGIGGSDTSSIMNVNKYRSIQDLWNEKVNKQSPEITSDAIHWGNMLEDKVGEEFSIQTGLAIEKFPYIIANEKYPFAQANIDFLGTDKEGNKFILECKTANFFKNKEWETGVPDYYYWQVVHYLMVMELDYGYIACLVGGQHFYIHKIEPSQKDFDKLLKAEQDFWKHVEDKDPIPVIKQVLERKSLGEVDMIADRYLKLQKEISELKKKMDQVKKEMTEAIQASGKDSLLTEAYTITLSSVSTKRFDSKAFAKDNPTVYNNYVKTSTYSKIKIKKA